MYNSTDILKMLNEGKTVDEIAKSFTNALNEAQKKKEEESKACLRRKTQIKDMEEILDSIISYITKYYPNLPVEELKEALDAEEIVDSMEELVKEFKNLSKTLESLTSTPAAKTKKTAPSSYPIDFDAFFKKYGL